MKIVSQTADTLVLKEGRLSQIVLGVVFTILGVAVAVIASKDTAVLLGGIVFALIGAALVLFASSIAVTISKKTKQLTYQKKRFVGTKTTTHALDDILRIDTRKQWRTQNQNLNQGGMAGQQVLVSQSVIVLKDGNELALDHKKKHGANYGIGSAVLMGGQGRESATANKVAAFIGVPFEDVAPNAGPRINLSGPGNFPIV